MASDAPRFNGVVASWSNLRLKIRGTNVSIDPDDFFAFKWKQSLSPGSAQGRGSGRRGRTEGEYETEMELGLYKDAHRRLMQALKAAHPKGKAGKVVFDVLAQWIPEDADDDELSEVEGRGCRVMESGGDASEGNEAQQVTIPLDVMRVFEDGVCLIGDQ